jgi:hypothetical protein
VGVRARMLPSFRLYFFDCGLGRSRSRGR